MNNGVTLKIEGDLGNGLTNEIVFLLDDCVFARINTKDLQPSYTSTESIKAEKNSIVDLGKNVVSIEQVYNTTDSKDETNYFVVDYADNFSNKIILPFNNLFNIDTPRYLSKDGDKIFFVLNDIVYMFVNDNFQVQPIFAKNLQILNIYKIVCFDNYIFIFSKDSPYINAFVLEDDNSLTKCSFDLSAFEFNSNIEQFIDIDIVQGKNGVFMLGFYAPISGATAYTLYLTFDISTKSFIYSSYLSNVQTTFNHLLAFHKNNFSDAQMLYLMSGSTASKCKRALHSLDGTSTTSYNITSYYYTYQTTNVCIKSRAVVVEKNMSPNLWLYYYPQIYRYALPELENAEKTYISTNLLYIIQRFSNHTFKAYNLVGYYTIEEFSEGIPSDIDQSKILSVEFLKDTVLFFMDDDNEPIIAYNLKLDKTCLENVSTQNGTYSISLTRKHNLGDNNEGVIATFAINITI